LDDTQTKITSLQNKTKELNFQTDNLLARKEKQFAEKIDSER
ncbi:MAG: hypothetical protein EZS28_043610, partial [Streblomastix strix]